MPFLKTAKAHIIPGHEDINWVDWKNISNIDPFKNRTASKVIRNYDPSKFLLTHCTIIASVNVESHCEHYITPVTEKYVNNNLDSWESDLLALPDVYRSFIGAYNYVEHIQQPSLSKGRVISAALRQVPADQKNSEQIYLVDILVATDRKHEDLVNKISRGELNTLSMGCHVAYTICSRCGNKAYDEGQLCSHIKNEKGSHFYDKDGVKRIVAELCGHKSDSNSVRFIEASWVAIPAFSGAVMRNIISFQDSEKGEQMKDKYATLIEDAHNHDPESDLTETMGKAASYKTNINDICNGLYKIGYRLKYGE